MAFKLALDAKMDRALAVRAAQTGLTKQQLVSLAVDSLLKTPADSDDQD